MRVVLEREEIQKANEYLSDKTPHEIIEWALLVAKNPLVTTNFRPYEVAILNAVSKVDKDMKVIWCDTGYNTPNTYRHADELIDQLQLNVYLYVPLKQQVIEMQRWGFHQSMIQSINYLQNK